MQTKIIKVVEFVERAKLYAHLITRGVILVDLKAHEPIEKRTVSVFLVEKRSRQISRSTKNTVMKSFITLTPNFNRP